MKKKISAVGIVFLTVLVCCGCECDKADPSRDANKATEAPVVKVDQYDDFFFDIENNSAYPCLYLDQEKNIIDVSGVGSAEVLYINYDSFAYHFLAASNLKGIENLRIVIQTDALKHCENLKLLIIDDAWGENFFVDDIKDEIKRIKEKNIVVCCYSKSKIWDQLSSQ